MGGGEEGSKGILSPHSCPNTSRGRGGTEPAGKVKLFNKVALKSRGGLALQLADYPGLLNSGGNPYGGQKRVSALKHDVALVVVLSTVFTRHMRGKLGW